jgi:hypothetical protein
MKDKVKVQEIVIDGTTYVPKESILQLADKKDGMPFVCIRTYSAGVHCGYLKERNGKEVTLLDSIRIHQWSGAASLSQLAMEGVNNPNSCRFAIPVNEIILTEVIEVIPMTEKAVENIKNVPSGKK